MSIYGWKPGAKHNKRQNYAMILGAKKIEGREYVYFTKSLDFTENTESYIRKHIPFPTDAKIYVVSHKTFLNYLNDLYPPKLPANTRNLDFENLMNRLVSSFKIEPDLDGSLRKRYIERAWDGIGDDNWRWMG